jgi:parallel beta helix pectate lyase-like protein
MLGIFCLRKPVCFTILLLLGGFATSQQVFYNVSTREMWNNKVYISWQNITHVYQSNSQNVTIDVLKFDDNGDNDPRNDLDRIVGNIQNDTAHGIGFCFSGVSPEIDGAPWGTVTQNPGGSATLTLTRNTSNGQATSAYTIFPNSSVIHVSLAASPTTTPADYHWGIQQRNSAWVNRNPGTMLLYDRACLNATTLIAQTKIGSGPATQGIDYLKLQNQLSGYAGLASTTNSWTMGIVVLNTQVPFDLYSYLVMSSKYGGWAFMRTVLFDIPSKLQPGNTYTFQALIYNDHTGNFQGLGNVGKSPLLVPQQYQTIQAAINVATTGGTVLVAPGTYNETIDFLGKDIVVRSTQGAAKTTIHGGGNGSTVSFRTGETRLAVLEGFTITGGSGTNGAGGGIYCSSASPTIRGNVISGNTCPGLGGTGGGIYIAASGGPLIVDNIITGNVVSSSGAGIACAGSLPTIANNVIHNNQATNGAGGGIYCNGCKGAMDVVNNTIYGNSAPAGGGLACQGSTNVRMTNTILWNNSATSFGPEMWVGSVLFPSTVTASYSNVKGGQAGVQVNAGCTLNWGTNMMNASPLFVAANTGDFHIQYGSPCRDAGTNAANGIQATDYEGDVRTYGSGADIGADEFHPRVYHTGQMRPGGKININMIGAPSCPVLWAFSLNPTPLNPPLNIPGCGNLYLAPPFLFGFNTTIGSSGVVTIPLSIPTNFPTNAVFPTQALIGAVLSNLDMI